MRSHLYDQKFWAIYGCFMLRNEKVSACMIYNHFNGTFAWETIKTLRESTLDKCNHIIRVLHISILFLVRLVFWPKSNQWARNLNCQVPINSSPSQLCNHCVTLTTFTITVRCFRPACLSICPIATASTASSCFQPLATTLNRS